MTATRILPNGRPLSPTPQALRAPQQTAPSAAAETTFEPAVGARPVPVESAPAQSAAKKALDYLRGQSFMPGPDLKLKSIDADDLGMQHVRFDRMHHGLPVYGEQMIAHLNREGSVVGVTGTAQPIGRLNTQSPALGPQDAKRVALEAFGDDVQNLPSPEKIVFRAQDGSYRVAYHVECVNLSLASGPKKQNYIIDAESGAVLEQWNPLQGFMHGHGDEAPAHDAPRAQRLFDFPWPGRAGAESKRTPDGRRMAEQTSDGPARIEDGKELEYSFTVDDDFRAGQIQLDLDIDHPNRSDLIVLLISPTGKMGWVAGREGRFGDKDLKGTFDLYGLFDREPVKGEWKLYVADAAEGDQGKLNSWKIRMVEGDERGVAREAGERDDKTLYSGAVDIASTKLADGSYQLYDKSRGQGVETRDSMEGPGAIRGKAITDDNDIWGEATDDASQKAAVDAQFGAQTTYDYYRDILGRDSYDGEGGKLTNNINSGRARGNAVWDGQQMHYGNNSDGSSLVAMDVAGHEITHGLTQHSAGLRYVGESGGLNEAMSDIIGGAGVEWYAMQKNPELQRVMDPYMIGETMVAPGKTPMRVMSDPTADKYSLDNYSNYASSDREVHRTSGIANNAFYLLTHGGTNRTSQIEVKDGIGMEHGLKIFSRALLHYMTPTTTFSEARNATVMAASDLYGMFSKEVQKVKEAWTAVGVR